MKGKEARAPQPAFRRWAQVAVPLPLAGTFTYGLSPGQETSLQPGVRVLVPFGPRHLVGLVWEVSQDPPQGPVKGVTRILDSTPLLSEPLLELAEWVSRYYVSPVGQVLKAMLPPGLLARKASPQSRRIWPAKRRLAVLEILPQEPPPLASQRALLEKLRRLQLPALISEVCRQTGAGRGRLQTLASSGWIRIGPVEVPRSPWDAFLPARAEPIQRHRLTPSQREVVEELKGLLAEKHFHSALLHGVTGSGKTEVYLNLIAEALRQGRSGLMLVPEIGLTPQMAQSFRAWFGEKVALLHSGLSDGERFDQWRKVFQGAAQVVVGTRSAVFAPVKNLGILIVDEEHDGSYKQDESPRYHAREVALKRGRLEGALVLLGSATPQLETFYLARERGLHRYLCLAGRILQRPLPTVHVVDMRVEFERHGKASLFSDLLKERLRHCLASGRQALILLNRRGYAQALLCRSCGHTEQCRNCSISLTYHRSGRRLSCHYCNYSRSVPQQCRQCGKEYVQLWGQGTEKIQLALEKLFPGARVDRLDRDATRRRGSLSQILGRFGRGKTDILVGTQMIAKGHDFPGVTLVGVLAADQGLRIPDFRAAERTFQLLTQVAGRAGRGEEPGEVVIQTYYPNHYSLKYACLQNYQLFYDQEREFRRRFRYPPFTALANLLFSGEDAKEVAQEAHRWGEELRQARDELSHSQRMRILGPAWAALERIKGEFRYQILIKCTRPPELQSVLCRQLQSRQRGSKVRVLVDVDPLNLL